MMVQATRRCARPPALQRDDLARDFRRARPVVQRVKLLGGIGQHRGAARVLRKRRREAQGAVDRRDPDLLRVCRRKLSFPLCVGEQRGIAGVGAVRVRRIGVRRLLVLGRRLGVAAVLVQQLGEQEAVLRRLRLLRKRGQVASVPASRLLVILALLRLLGRRVVVAGELLQVRLHQRLRAVRPALGVAALIVAADAVVRHVLLLGIERERGESVR